MKVTVYHNVSDDASFGVNTNLVSDETERGYHKELVPRSHPLVKVYEYDVPDSPDARSAVAVAVHLFNVGDDPAFGTPSPVALAYRARRLRSLSVGDVLQVGDNYYSTYGELLTPDELRFVEGDEAVALVRERYQFRPDETELAVTVPLA